MSDLADRLKGFEALYDQDQDLQFRVAVRRAKIFGLWAAKRMGLGGDAAEVYARQVLAADLDKPGIEDMLDKVSADLAANGVSLSDHQLRLEADIALEMAKRQVMDG
jgi:hypothetical protein